MKWCGVGVPEVVGNLGHVCIRLAQHRKRLLQPHLIQQGAVAQPRSSGQWTMLRSLSRRAPGSAAGRQLRSAAHVSNPTPCTGSPPGPTHQHLEPSGRRLRVGDEPFATQAGMQRRYDERLGQSIAARGGGCPEGRCCWETCASGAVMVNSRSVGWLWATYSSDRRPTGGSRGPGERMPSNENAVERGLVYASYTPGNRRILGRESRISGTASLCSSDPFARDKIQPIRP